MIKIIKKNDDYDIRIFTEGGVNFGYGHITRCISLYDELAARGHRPIFIINGDKEVESVVNNRHCIIDSWCGNTNLYLYNKPYSIVDSYHADLMDYTEIKKNSRNALFIDDNYRLDYPEGIVVNPSIYGDNIKYVKKNGQTLLLGSRFVVLRKEFTEPITRKAKQDVENILVIMGGSDVADITPDIIKSINKIDNCARRLHVVIGRGFTNIDKIRECTENCNAQLYYNLNAQDLRNIMLCCDMAVSAAGQTTNELIATQTPFISVKIADNQKNNLDGLLFYGIVNDFINHTEQKFDIKKFGTLYNSLLNYETRQNIISKMALLNISLGTKNIIDHLLER